MKTTNNSIFSSLVKKYVSFVLIVIASVLLTILFILYQINYSGSNGQAPKLTSIDIAQADYENINISDVKAVGGWVEILDEKLNVIYVKGDKKDDYQCYSQKDIIDILNMDSHSRYLGVMQQFKTNDGRGLYCLVKYPSNTFHLQLNMNNTPYQTGRIIYDNLLKGAVLFLLLSIINIMLFSKWTSNKINKPLTEITIGIKKMTLNNDYTTQIDFEAEKEFALIRDSFNSMVHKLKDAEDEKIRMQQGKMRMLADLSHDIKTPITTIQGFSKALSEGLVNDEKKKQRYYSTIYTKGEQVKELIDDMSVFINLENSDYNLSIMKHDFCEFIRNIITEFYDEIEEKNFELVINIPSKETLAEFDEKLINRAVSNMLHNALKYNPSGTRLRIGLEDSPDALVLEIGDNGTGIPAHIKDSIFDPFVRGDESRKSHGGTGLGLAIARKIIYAHQGSLELISNANNERTTFLMILPKIKA